MKLAEVSKLSIIICKKFNYKQKLEIYLEDVICKFGAPRRARGEGNL